MVRLLAEDTQFPVKALGQILWVSRLSNLYRPSSIPVKIGWKPRGIPPGFGTLTVPWFTKVLVLAGVRELSVSEDGFVITREEAASGFMTVPVPSEDVDPTEVTLTRRIPVEEHWATGWRTRTVDHAKSKPH